MRGPQRYRLKIESMGKERNENERFLGKKS